MDAPKKGMFAPIETKAEAAKACKEAAVAFLFIGALQAALAYFLSPSILIDAGLYLLLGVALLLWKSRTAAILLLILATVALAVTVLNKLGMMASGGTNIILAIIIVGAAIRAIQATFKFHTLAASTAKGQPPLGPGMPGGRGARQ